MKKEELISSLALSTFGTIEKPHFDKISYRVKNKIFATLDSKKKVLVLKFNEIDQSVFSDIGKSYIYPVPGGWGRHGWTILEYDSLEIELLTDALTVSYNTVFKAR